MELAEVTLPIKNDLLKQYVLEDERLGKYFDYIGSNQTVFSSRSTEILKRQFPREELTEYLLDFHKRFNVSDETVVNIEKLRLPNSVAVIGGQQAGLLTGPAYTIHKIVSIIKLAKQQEKALNIPVIPIFWVAGEDHDFDEINHLIVQKNGVPQKVKVHDKQYRKDSVSHIHMNKDVCRSWVKEIFEAFGETRYTKDILNNVEKYISISTSYVDFFIHLVYMLFPKSGLVVLDSGDNALRKMEGPFFEQLIEKNDELTNRVFKTQLSFREDGYGEPLEISPQNAHLFIRYEKERVLLEKKTDNHFVGKNNRMQLTKEELLQIARENPHILSNNVVTRPLMQEFLFPTLAFIGGPGEIAYWGLLRSAFHLFSFHMPPIIPRLNITILNKKHLDFLYDKHISIEAALESGLEQDKEKWIREQEVYNIDENMEAAMNKLEELHRPLRDLAVVIDHGLADITLKNSDLIKKQLAYLKKQMERSIRVKYSAEITKFDTVNFVIRPTGVPQERVLNIFQFLNSNGPSFLNELVEIDFTFNGKHKLVLL